MRKIIFYKDFYRNKSMNSSLIATKIRENDNNIEVITDAGEKHTILILNIFGVFDESRISKNIGPNNKNPEIDKYELTYDMRSQKNNENFNVRFAEMQNLREGFIDKNELRKYNKDFCINIAKITIKLISTNIVENMFLFPAIQNISKFRDMLHGKETVASLYNDFKHANNSMSILETFDNVADYQNFLQDTIGMKNNKYEKRHDEKEEEEINMVHGFSPSLKFK